MVRLKTRTGFTLIELLVVVAIIALLIAILLPSLAAAKEQSKKSKCMANLRSISQASALYAAEDEKELVIPIHRATFNEKYAFGGIFWWRMQAHHFGGRQATTSINGWKNLTDPNMGMSPDTKPLNKYLMGQVSKLDDPDHSAWKVYECPSDTGFPENSNWINLNYVGNTAATYDQKLFDLLGNSYRYNTIGVVYTVGGGSFSFTSGPSGSRTSKLPNPSRLVTYAEPLFYVMTIPGAVQQGSVESAPLLGWHKKRMTENVAFLDGSCRFTKVDKLADFGSAPPAAGMLKDMGYYSPLIGIDSPPGVLFLRRGKSWQTDAYPAPGSLIRGKNSAEQDLGNATYNSTLFTPYGNGWPFRPYQDNLRP